MKINSQGRPLRVSFFQGGHQGTNPIPQNPDCAFSIPHSSFRNPKPPFRNAQSAIPNPQSVFRNAQSAIPNPQSVFRNPQSAIPNPQSAIRNPQLEVVSFRPLSMDILKDLELLVLSRYPVIAVETYEEERLTEALHRISEKLTISVFRLDHHRGIETQRPG